MVLSTLKGARHDTGLVARLQEIAGRPGRATLSLQGRTIARAWRTDLLERARADLPFAPDGSLAVDVPPWGLTTVRLLPEP